MERTKNSKKLVTLSSDIVNRIQLAAAMGVQTYDGNRDIFQILGYPTSLEYKNYYARYKRQDLAYAIIDRPVKATWGGDILLSEDGITENTKLEEAYEKLIKDFKLKSIFIRVDTLTCLGQFGILLIGLDDVADLEGFKNPVKEGTRKLLYVKPFGQGNVTINTVETNITSERYGHPVIYQITVTNDIVGSSLNTVSTSTINVHYTRVIHIAQDVLENDLIGTPVLEAVFNLLLNVEKIVGGDSEMYWRGARPGYQGKVDKDYQMTPATKLDLQDQLDEYEHNLRRILVNDGVDFTSLAQQIADPSNHLDVQIQLISAKTNIPKRILTGSERGELSSTQDKDTWDTYISTRREYAETQIIKQFVDFCIKYGILPKGISESYSILWEDLFAPSEKSKAEVGQTRANALREYATMIGAQEIISPEAFQELFLGLSDVQIARVKQLQGSALSEEIKSNREDAELAEEFPPVVTPVIKTKTKPV